MFERVLETVLEKALGEFVQDINSEDLKLKVWSGESSIWQENFGPCLCSFEPDFLISLIKPVS